MVEKKKYIFVGGSPRSGTTLLQKILIGHSKISGGCEFMHLGEITNLYNIMSSPHHLERQDIFYDKEGLDENFHNFVGSFFTQLANSKPELEYICEKTPDNIYCAADLLKMFPDSKFIVISRDGRDVVSSLLEVAKREEDGGKSFSTFGSAKIWNQAIAVERSLKEGPYAQRVMSVKYEDLVSEQDAEVSKLMNFLGLEVEQAQFETEKIKREDLGNRHKNDAWYTDKMYSMPITANRISRWKEKLPKHVSIFSQILMSHNLLHMGYSVEPTYSKLGMMLRGILRRLKIG